jgi:YHS domain-containing protein
MKKLKVFIFLFLFFAVACFAQKGEVFATEKGAVDGYDPVAYFTEGKPIVGQTTFVHKWKEATWHFNSQKNLDLFKAAPEKYAPQFGGYCAFGMARGYKAKTDPAAWSIVGGKLYLNYNSDVQKDWLKNQKAFIEKADANWPLVQSKE